MKRGRFCLAVILGFVWIGGSGIGLAKLGAYSNTPGQSGKIFSAWPKKSSINRKQPFTLLLFLHPACSCSNATLEELDSLLAKAEPRPETYVIFTSPKRWSINKIQSDLWKKATAIPGVQVLIDSMSIESKLFGAKTSGQVYLFNSHGEMKFAGGITAARGHAGDNQGKANVLDILKNENKKIATTNVFGCALFDRISRGIL
jgi:hypothetical protein